MLLPLHLNNLLQSPGASVVVTGTLDGSTEDDIRAGGRTIVLTVSDDTFVVLNDTIRQAILDGITSAQTELTGWNNEVRDKEVVGAVVRDSATQITITLSAAAGYDITANETITVTVPATALTGGGAVVATPDLTVTYVPVVVVSSVKPAGKKMPRSRPLVVEIDGEPFFVETVQEAQQLLDQAYDVERDQVESEKSKPVDQPSRVEAGVPVIRTTDKVLQSVVANAQQRIRELHEQRLAELEAYREIQELLQAQIDAEEEAAIILLLVS